jgi:hypothetical protein
MAGYPKDKHKTDPDSPSKIPPGVDDGMTLRDLLLDNAFNKLIGKAKNLTVGQTWRLNGWSIPSSGDPAPNDDPVLKNLSMDEVKSIADAFEVHLMNHGNTKGWKYTNPTYACGACCGSCAVGMDDQYQD